MKTLIKLALAAVILCSTFAAQAEWVSGYSRANGTYVNGYSRATRCDSPYSTPSYSSQTMPSYSSSYTATTYSSPSYSSTYVSGHSGTTSVYGSSSTYGNTTYHNYSSSDGGYLSGTTSTYGNTTYTSLYGSGW